MTNNQSQIKGILWMILHCLLISSIVIIAKFLGQNNYSEGQVVFFHSFVAFVILLPFAIYFEGKNIVKTKLFMWHLSRGILGTASLFLYFFALKFIPLNDGRALALLSPVVTFIFAVIFFKEVLDFSKIAVLIISLIGGYIIINPNGVHFHSASLLILLAMIMWSIIDLIVKKLSKSESSIKQLFFLSAFLSLFSLPFALSDWQTPHNSLDMFLLILIGVIFIFNSLALFLAIKHGDLTTIMPFDFCGMIFTMILSYLIFGEIIKNHVLLGSIIVFLSSLYLIYHESKKAKKFTKIAESNISKN